MRKSQPWYRRMLGKAFHLLASVWVVGPVKDTQCGFKGFSRAAAQDLFARQKISSIVFDVELIFLARKRGYRLGVIPIRWADRRGSRMRATPGLALRVCVGSLPDSADPSRDRTGCRAVGQGGRRRGFGRRLASRIRESRRHRRAWPERPSRSLRSSSSVSSSGGRCGPPRARARSASTSSPTTRRRTGSSPASACTTRRSSRPAASASSTIRRRSSSRSCRSPRSIRRSRRGPGSDCRSRRSSWAWRSCPWRRRSAG